MKPKKHALSEIVAVLLVMAIVIGIPTISRGYHLATKVSDDREGSISLIARNDNVAGQAGVWLVQESDFWNFADASGSSRITVNQGSEVRLLLTAVDTVHEFSLPDFGITTVVYPGKVSEVTFLADKTGIHTFECVTFCGAGHNEMRGAIIVLPEIANLNASSLQTGADS